jgi:hypothetical protein
MPTGYTFNVVDGKLTDFPSFAMQCARAFGALIDMRDDPLSAPVPETISSDTSHYEKRLADARKERAELLAMDKKAIFDETMATNKARQKSWQESLDRVRLENKRIEDMKSKVMAWRPPTDDHVGLWDFMVNQLEISKTDESYYLNPPKVLTPDEWFAEEVESSDWNIKYYQEQIDEERKRSGGRNEWVQNLRRSLQEYK